jgi:phosphoribosylformylglycinamidine cyclo-ligase
MIAPDRTRTLSLGSRAARWNIQFRQATRPASLVVWHQEARHCPLCGAELEPGVVEGRDRLRCPRCRFVLYRNPACAAAGVVLDARGRVLLIRRALEPHKGAWALPAGYQEIDEEPGRACEREVREETGLTVEAVTLFDLIFVPENVRKPANLAVFLCRVVSGTLRSGDDALDARWFGLDDLPADIGFDNAGLILSRLRGSDAHRRFLKSMSPSERTPHLSYKDAGVDIAEKYAAVEGARQAIRSSFTAGVVGDVGGFGGLFDLARVDAAGGLLVASADGVGTKLEVAKRAGVFDGVGRDLVQHCINDILVQGARPLFFMDYVGTGVLERDKVSQLIGGCARACRDNGLALLGGETAEMPGLYAPGDFDLVGFIVGTVQREMLLDGSRVRPGLTLVGLSSAGLHTNGYSLARKIAFEVLGLGIDDRPAALNGVSIGEALLAEHRSYLKLLWPLLEENRICAMAHITGGGLVDNLPRILGTCDAIIDRESWEVPALFRFLCEAGGVDRDEAYQAFNMGIGMVLLVEADEAPQVRERLRARGEETVIIGRLEAGVGQVRWGK